MTEVEKDLKEFRSYLKYFISQNKLEKAIEFFKIKWKIYVGTALIAHRDFDADPGILGLIVLAHSVFGERAQSIVDDCHLKYIGRLEERNMPKY